MPSQARIMKSWSLVILNDVISGTQTTTFGFPPLNSYLASGSPNVFDTDNLPGRTLIGPTM